MRGPRQSTKGVRISMLGRRMTCFLVARIHRTFQAHGARSAHGALQGHHTWQCSPKASFIWLVQRRASKCAPRTNSQAPRIEMRTSDKLAAAIPPAWLCTNHCSPLPHQKQPTYNKIQCVCTCTAGALAIRPWHTLAQQSCLPANVRQPWKWL